MSQPDDRGIEISNVPSEARSAEGWCLGQWLLFPQIWSRNRAQVSPILGSCSPHFRAQPRPSSPSGSVRSFLPPLHGPIRPFFFPFLCTPLPYALSPFPSTFSPPILVSSSSLSRGAPHPARGSNQPSSVNSPVDPGRARLTNGLWTAFWGQNSYSGDSNLYCRAVCMFSVKQLAKLYIAWYERGQGRLKTRDRKTRHRQKYRGGKHGTGKPGTKSHGWKTRDRKTRHQLAGVRGKRRNKLYGQPMGQFLQFIETTVSLIL